MAKQRLHELALADLMQAHKSATETLESLDTQTPSRTTAKSKDTSYIKLTAYVPRGLHAQFKAKAALEQREISAVILDFVKNYVSTPPVS